MSPNLKLLRRSWFLLLFLTGLLLLFAFNRFSVDWSAPNALRWTIQAAFALSIQLAIFWKDLALNHRPGQKKLLPDFGLGTQISLIRLLSVGLLAGFLFLPAPPSVLAWLPAAIYLLANLSDFFDGYLARITNHVTQLGQKLDLDLDGRALLIASLLAYQYGKVPWYFLLVGIARYAFLYGLSRREKKGLPVYELEPNMNRRALAGTQMVFSIAMLVPIFSPPETWLAATLFMFPFLGNFLADWWQVSGQKELYQRWTHFWERNLMLASNNAALLIRLFTAAFLILRAFQSPTNNSLFIIELLGASSLILGAAGRAASAILLIETGLRQSFTSLGPLDWGVLAGCSIILFLGTGSFSLWQPEIPLISRRPGDSSGQ